MSKQTDEAALEADRIHREMYPKQYEDLDSPDKDQEENEDTPVSSDSEKTDEQSAPLEKDETPATEERAPEPKQEDDWKQKYSVLKGKYDSEVPRLHSDLSALRQVVNDLQTQVTSSVKKQEQKDEKPSNEALDFVEREYPDIYKAMVSMLDKRQDSVRPDDTELRHRIEAVERVAVESAEDRFYRDLDAGMSDWRVHKEDPRFLEWLNEEDSLTGLSRLQLAQQAQQALDGKRVAKFYKGFVKDLAGHAPTTTTVTTSKKDITKFVAPPASGSGGAAGKTGTDQNILKTSDIKRFYDDANKGRYRGREAEFSKMEAKIDRAVADGNVVKD